MTSEMTPGREPVQIVEIRQPLCSRTFGTSPCTASGTGDTKCYNTRATCQDTTNFALASEPLSLFFSSGSVAEQTVEGAPYIIPSLVSVSTSPSTINLATASPDSRGLGNRALCSITFQDHPHTDRRVDPYMDGRSWDPLNADRGSFWSRWLARNLYRSNVEVRVYEGYAGQALSAMSRRTYFIDSMSQVDSRGRVTLKGKDVLARLENREAQAPVASPGVLREGVNETQLTFDAVNAVLSEYPSVGLVRIDDELIAYSAIADAGNNRLTFTVSERGARGTVAAEHSFDAAIQLCLEYVNQRVDSVVSNLLTEYGKIDTSWLDTAAWAVEVDDHLSLYKLNTIISEPTGVYTLVSELQEQLVFNLWWDERSAIVRLKAARGFETPPPVIDDSQNILADSFRIEDLPRERASQVWAYYNPRTAIANLTQGESFLNQYVIADLASETEELYGSASVRIIFSRWLNSGPALRYTTNRILSNYSEMPQKARFALDAKDRVYWLADDLYISHYLDVDGFGSRRVRKWTIISAEETSPGETVEYEAQLTESFGQLHYIMETGSANFSGYEAAPVRNCYIGDGEGKLSDGSLAGVIA